MKNNKQQGKSQGNVKNRTRKKSYKPKDRKFDQTEPVDSRDPRRYDNDPNWYFLDANVAAQAASISFNQYVGQTVNIDAISAGGMHSTKQYNVPGVLVLPMAPSIGETVTPTSGINMANLKLYSTLSSKNAKTTNYAPQDITMLELALGEILSMFEHIRRVFGIAMTYNQRNRLLPKALIAASGVQSDDFFKKLADYRLEFNTLVTLVNQIPFPATMAYMYKCMDMYQNVYTDGTSAMSQIIMLVPGLTWLLSESATDTGSVLSTVELPTLKFTDAQNITTLPESSLWTMGQWLSQLRTMIQTLMTSSTFNYIYSDILNYADKTGVKLFYLDYLLESYSVVPTYNMNFLLQIHNMTILGMPLKKGTESGTTAFTYNDVSSDVDTNSVVYDPTFAILSNVGVFSKYIVDFPTPTATAVDIIEGTRYLAIGRGVNNQRTGTKYSLPDHYCVLGFIINFLSEASGANLVYYVGCSSNATDALSDFEAFYTQLTQFDWAPLCYIYSSNAFELIGDLNYYTTVTGEWLRRVNDLAYQALFEIR